MKKNIYLFFVCFFIRVLCVIIYLFFLLYSVFFTCLFLVFLKRFLLRRHSRFCKFQFCGSVSYFQVLRFQRLRVTWLQNLMIRVTLAVCWRNDWVLDLWSRGRVFDSRSGRDQVVTTWMGDCLQTGKPSQYITSRGQLSFSSHRGRSVSYTHLTLPTKRIV